MTRASSLPYRLRPNKAVDRELFLSLLSRLSHSLNIPSYKYVGLGGPFLEDFRLVHARIGIRDMDCIEMEEAVHQRQLFNRPLESIKCVHSALEDYLSSSEFMSPIVLWLDYTDPRQLRAQIESFADQALELPLGSVVRITLNANPESLGKPPAGLESTVLPFRFTNFRARVGDYCPADLVNVDMSQSRFSTSVLRALKLAVDKRMLEVRDRKVCWALATTYADGQAMATATIVVVAESDTVIESLLSGWEFHTFPSEPLVLDMPALSTLERLTMEAYDDPKSMMTFPLPPSAMGQDPFDAFKKFYRVFPHFSRVEL